MTPGRIRLRCVVCGVVVKDHELPGHVDDSGHVEFRVVGSTGVESAAFRTRAPSGRWT